jgi:ferredoxin
VRISVDRTRCESNAVCTGVAPSVFEIDDDDVMHVLVELPPSDLLGAVQEAVQQCPKQAISLVEQ